MTDSLLDQFDCESSRLGTMLDDVLSGADDGELFVEKLESESLVFDDGKLKSGSFDTRSGFGLRAVCGDSAGYAHSGELTQAAFKRAASAVQAVSGGHSGSYAGPD